MASRTQPRTDKALLTRIASMAAEQAVQKTFTTLGVDITTPAAVIEAQELFLSLRSLKRDWTVFRNRFVATVGGLLATGLVMAVLHYLKPPPL